jgi:hypothetical protein
MDKNQEKDRTILGGGVLSSSRVGVVRLCVCIFSFFFENGSEAWQNISVCQVRDRGRAQQNKRRTAAKKTLR